MGFQRIMRDDGVLLSRLTGQVGSDEIEEHVEQLLALTKGKDEFFEIVYHEFGAYLDLNPEDVNLIEDFAAKLVGQKKFCVVAFVAQSDLSHSTCTQIAARLHGKGAMQMKVFSEMEEADQWINEVRGTGNEG